MRILAIALLPWIAASAQSPVEDGSTLVKQRCSVGYCHGLEGRAGRAPRLGNRGFEREYLNKVIRDGIPNSAMPAFKATLTEPQINAVIAYVMSLTPGGAPVAPPPPPLVRPEAATSAAKVPAGFGDPARGRDIFFDLANEMNCGVCHANGVAAPDPAKLKGKSARDLLRDIVQPGASLNSAFAHVQVKLKSGEEFSGIRTEQTAARVRVLDTGSTPPVLRTIPLAEIAEQRTLPGSAMPSGASYSFSDLTHLIAFLKQAPVDPAELLSR